MTEFGLENLDITKDELSRFTKAFKNDEFKKLFAEYCEEITDPENKKRYEEELTQLERERGIDVTFINPEPGFVIKTSVNGKQKAFINVAVCDKVAKPTSTCGTDGQGHRGLNWSIPYTQSAPRKDSDKQGELCVVYDVVFHPNALHLGAKNKDFRQLLINTACDAVKTVYNVQIDMANIKFPKMKYKGISRPTIIRKKNTNAQVDDIEASPIDKIYPPLKEHTAKQIPTKTVTNSKKLIKECEKYAIPTYQIVHRKNVEYHEMTNELDAKINATIPNELSIRIDLPLIRSTDDVTLDVTAKKLFLISETPAKYKLSIDLPFTIDEFSGNAKFDQSKRQLLINLPIVKTKTITVPDLYRGNSDIESESLKKESLPDDDDSEVFKPNDIKKEEVLQDVPNVPAKLPANDVRYFYTHFSLIQCNFVFIFITGA